MRKLFPFLIGLIIISLVGVFILKTGNCGMFTHKIPFELKGILYYQDSSGEISKYNFSEAKVEKTLLPGGLFNRGFRFLFLTSGSTPYRTFRLTKCNLKDEIIEEWELPTTHPIWWCRNSDLSPNQKLVAGVREIDRSRFDKFKLLVSPLNRLDEKVITEDLCNSAIVWISNTDLLYTDINNELIQINISTRKKEKLGCQKEEIYVGTLSPNGRFVLCSSDRGGVYLLDIFNKNLTRLKGISDGGNFIWSPNGKYFVFGKYRHLLISLLDGSFFHKGFEIADVYVYSLEHKREYRLFKNNTIFDGFWLEE